MRFGLSARDWKIIEDVLVSPIKMHGGRVWIFGSRARGSHRAFSDLDVLFSVSTPLPSGELYLIKTALEESNLPMKVDLVDERDLAEAYRAQILAERIEA